MKAWAFTYHLMLTKITATGAYINHIQTFTYDVITHQARVVAKLRLKSGYGWIITSHSLWGYIFLTHIDTGSANLYSKNENKTNLK